MTTTPEKPRKTEVAKLTAVTNPEPLMPWPSREKVTELADTLDMIRPHLDAMADAWRKLQDANDYTRKQILQEAENVIARFEKTEWTDSLNRKRLDDLWNECNQGSWWPEDSDAPVCSEVAKMITGLMASFPTDKIPNPKIFVRMLLEDVMALDPMFTEMESTCRELRKSNKFMPAISEVLEELEKQQDIWSERQGVVCSLGYFHRELRDAIASVKVAEEARLARKQAAEEEAAKAAKAVAERKAAKSQPLVVGDRVRNPKLGAGTVIAVEQIIPEIARYRVRFDADVSRTVYGSGLERLIPGDEGFEPPIPKEVPTCPWDKDVRASDVPVQNNYDDEF